MKKVLVIGGGGFIGSHTVDLLLEKGIDVIVYDNFSSGKLSNLDLFNSKLEVIQSDIADYHKLVKQMARCDTVLHLAAIVSVQQTIEDPLRSIKTNLLGFLNVLQAMREMHQKPRLVYASSAAVYGNAEKLPCSDEDPLPPNVLSPYALEKANNERYAALYSQLYGINSLGLRYFNVYGTRQDVKSPYSGVITKFIYQYQNRKPLKVFGDGEQSRDFIHVADVARANLLALENDYNGILNIATGMPETLNNLISYIELSHGHKPEVEYENPRSGDILKSYGTTAKAQEKIGFRHSVSLKDGVKDLNI